MPDLSGWLDAAQTQNRPQSERGNEMIAAGLMIVGVILFVFGTIMLPNHKKGGVPLDKPFGYEMTDVDRAVLRAIPFRRVRDSDVKYGRATANDILAFRANIEALKTWAATLDEGPIKRAYLGWADAFQRWADEAEHEILTGVARQKDDADAARIQEILPTIPKMPMH